MPAGKLTIQAWHEEQDRQARKDEAVKELTREIIKLAFTTTRRRKPSLVRRFIRSMTF